MTSESIIFSIIASIVASIVSYWLLSSQKIPYTYIYKEIVEPDHMIYRQPMFPQSTSKVRIKSLSLEVRNADPRKIYVLALSNIDDYKVVIDASRSRSYVRPGELKGELYFPLLTLSLLRLHPDCDIREWDEVNKVYRVLIDIDSSVKRKFYWCVWNKDSTNAEVEGMVVADVEETPLSRFKFKLLKRQHPPGDEGGAAEGRPVD